MRYRNLEKVFSKYATKGTHFTFDIAIVSATIFLIYNQILAGTKSLLTDVPVSGKTAPLFVGDPIAGGQITFYKELAVTNSWSHLHFPFWLGTEGYGITLAGNQAAPWFFPEELIHVLFPNNLAIWNVIALVLAATGAYLLASKLELSRVGSIASAFTYSISGPAIANLNLDMINPLAVTPYVAIASIMLVESFDARSEDRLKLFSSSLFFAITISQLFLSGFAEALPLELLFVGVVFLARVLSLEKLNFKVFASISALWFAMLVLGIIGSSIALLTLLDPLQHYLSFQAVQSKFLNQPKYWYLTLLDPWSFAKDVTNSPFENGQTIWISSNPVAFALAISGSITGMFFAKGRWNRTWVATFSGVVLFGVLGFAGIFGLINVLAIPVLNMIAMQRFLGFLWWPAFAVLVGFGVDSLVDRRGRQGLIFGFFVTALAIAILWLDVIKKGPKLFAVIASQNIGSTIMRNLPILILLFVLPILVYIAAKLNASDVAAVVLLVFLTVLLVPKNFFPIHQAPQEAKGIALELQKAKLSHGLSFSPGNGVLPSGLISDDIPNIGAFDVFFPRGFAISLQSYFGFLPSMSPQSVLFPFAPAMVDVPISKENLRILSRLDVETAITSFPILPGSLANIVPSPKPKDLNVAPDLYYGALNTLIKVYQSRPDLVAIFSLNSIGSRLIPWAISTKSGDDSDKSVLAPYQGAYSTLGTYEESHSNFALFRVTSSNIVTPKLIGSSVFYGARQYVYDIGNGVDKYPISEVSRINFTNSSTLKPFDGTIFSAPLSLKTTLEHLIYKSTYRISDFTENSSSMTFRITASHDSLFAINRIIAPGEAIYINGVESKYVTLNGFVAGFKLKKGSSSIVVSYGSKFWVANFWLDVLLNLVLVVGALIGVVLSRQRRRMVADK